MPSEKFLLSENTMNSRVRYIAHINLLGCVPAMRCACDWTRLRDSM